MLVRFACGLSVRDVVQKSKTRNRKRRNPVEWREMKGAMMMMMIEKKPTDEREKNAKQCDNAMLMERQERRNSSAR